MHAKTQHFQAEAEALGLHLQVKEFDQTTGTAEAAAEAIGCTVEQIVKSLIFMVNNEPVMALVSGKNKLSEAKLAALLGVSKSQVKRADADAAKEFTGYAIGGVPPFGYKTAIRTFIDEDLMAFETVWAAAGTPNAVFPITPKALQETSKGQTADIKK
jgi:Cys-tRNA(Pro) deacylase